MKLGGLGSINYKRETPVSSGIIISASDHMAYFPLQNWGC